MTPPNARCWAEIDRSALDHNVHVLTSYGSQIMAVVKADAYGHGVSLVAPLLLEMGIRHFGVATVTEGIQIRRASESAGVRGVAIFVMTAVLPEEAETLLAHRLIPFVSDYSLARALSPAGAQGEEAEIHVEVDTGIGRAGIAPVETAKFVAACQALPNLRVTGICTHFTAADAADPQDAVVQFTLFEQALASLPREQLSQMTLHAANSPATLRLPAARLHLMRPGLLLYGIGPSLQFLTDEREGFAFRPVLSLKARVILARRLPAGTDISYSRTYTLPREATVATIGIGYGDGFPRRLSNCGHVLLPSGTRAPIRGRVCMDQLCIEVPEGEKLSAGDSVTLIGRAGDSEIRATEMADQIDTTPHEITTCLTARVPRILVDG